MELSQVFAVVAAWALLSVPASLLIGVCMSRKEQLQEPRLAEVRSFDRRVVA
jgi:hypothetical protein